MLMRTCYTFDIAETSLQNGGNADANYREEDTDQILRR